MNADDNQEKLFNAIGKIPSGVFILTARNDENETGMLASWVQQCGFAPPMVSVAVKKDRYLADWLCKGSYFTLSTIAKGQNNLLSHFGKGFELGQNAFENIAVERNGEYPPYLTDALGFLHCRVIDRSCPGDHHLIIGEVTEGRLLQQSDPWVHIRKSGKNY